MTESNSMTTGTTTVGLVCKDCVVLAADMRVTVGYQIANKDWEKVVQITDNIAVTIAGSVSAIQMLEKYLKSELKLRKIRLGREVTVKEAANLLRNWVYTLIRQPKMMQDISHFLMAGSDAEGLHLYDIFPDGTLHKVNDYFTSGSGSSYVFGLLEQHYKANLNEQEGIDLAIKAVDTAMQRDIASGNGVNVMVIDKNGVRKAATKKVDTHVK
jgi:proteasome beta subunit